MTTESLVRVGPVFIPQSEVQLGEFRGLYDHQVATIESDSNVIVVDAPTGAGKTLAALARVLERNLPTVFVYPTNSLVRDQARAIKKLLGRLGRKANLIDKEWTPEEMKNEPSDIVDVLHFTGETLEDLAAGGAKGTALEKILKGTYQEGRLRLILTNPDMLYIAMSGRYAHHGRIIEQLDTFKTFVVDEFHLYSGPSLARLVFMLNHLRVNEADPAIDVVFLSATHGETLDLITNTYKDVDIIRVEPLVEPGKMRRQVRHETTCALTTKNRVMTATDDVDQVAEALIEFYSRGYHWPKGKPNVKVLGIFSSVTFAVQVADTVKRRLNESGQAGEQIVRQLHGLIPHSTRPDIDELSECILVGTSAIEVGVDFDVPFLVMEAHDLASFLQRFGRGGRHNRCECVLYLPNTMVDRLKDASMWTFPEFVDLAVEAFRELPSYAGFMCSPQAREMLLSMALAGSQELQFYPERRMTYDLQSAVEYFRFLVDANATASLGDRPLSETIGSLDSKIIEIDLGHPRVKTMAEYSFLRGTMNSILVVFPGALVGSELERVYSELDVFEVFRLRGRLASARNHWERLPSGYKRRYDENDPIFIVDELGRAEYPRVMLTPDAYCRRHTAVFSDEVTIRVSNTQMRQVLRDLLENRNLVYFWRGMTKMIDYRIPRIYAEDENGAVVIGDWALVAEYLNKREEAR